MLSLQKSTNSVVIRYFYKERILVNLRNINRYKAILWLYSIYNWLNIINILTFGGNFDNA